MRFFSYDAQGNIRELAVAAGTVTDRYDYDAFGLLLRHEGTSDNVYLYTGEQWDPDLGLYFLRARFMNPNTGRFWNRDTYEGTPQDPIGLHKYLYASANPVTYFDSNGNFSLSELSVTQAVQSILRSLPGLALKRVFTNAIVGGVVNSGLAAALSVDERSISSITLNFAQGAIVGVAGGGIAEWARRFAATLGNRTILKAITLYGARPVGLAIVETASTLAVDVGAHNQTYTARQLARLFIANLALNVVFAIPSDLGNVVGETGHRMLHIVEQAKRIASETGGWPHGWSGMTPVERKHFEHLASFFLEPVIDLYNV